MTVTASLAKVGLFCGLAFSFAIGQADSGQADSVGGSNLITAPLIDKMARAQEENPPQTSYQEILKYRIFAANNTKPASEVVAEVDFQPPGTKRYAIQKSSGSHGAEQVVRGILDHEVEAAAHGRNFPSPAAIEGNYAVTYLGEDVVEGHPCFLIGLSPKRKDKNLIVGKAWVDKSSYLVRQIDGDLIKTPSWWLKKVHVKIMFDFVGGTWLQTSAEAMADVRIFGNHKLTTEILEFRNADVVARTRPAPPVPRQQ